eukprot:TRINITY_DN12534_c0_g1_i1.p1 TRINITY_DN12534_c0_g1~~TRINITY_DN12534_c0_g1_i1.p1  ORF type:complete len:263 (+),score=60.71 TRINITY_DN12534_c0_g1_i1:64-789(+)
MGQRGGKLKPHLDEDEIAYLLKKTHFTREEIIGLYNKYKWISSSIEDDGVIDVHEFQQALGFENSQVAKRIFKVIDENNDKKITFEEFCKGLSAYCSKAPLEDKLKFSFKIYDLDRDGYIDKEELFHMLQASLFENFLLELSEAQMRKLVDSTFEEVDLNSDGRLSFDEYRKMILSNPTLLASFDMKFVDPNMLVDDDEEDPLQYSSKLSKSSAAILVPNRGLTKSREASLSPEKKSPRNQ